MMSSTRSPFDRWTTSLARGAVALALAVSWSAGAQAQTPAAPAQMKMPMPDQRGGIGGAVTNATVGDGDVWAATFRVQRNFWP